MVTASIVVHRTRPGDLANALRCIKESSVGFCWVVDNSPDNSLEAIVREYGCTYVRVENRGFGAGHNVALRLALQRGARYHLVMNADVGWRGDVPGLLREYMEENPSVGLCAPRVLYPDGVLQYTCRMLPTPYDVAAKRFLPGWLTRKRMDRYLLARADHSVAFNVPYLMGCFMFFRCEALAREGLFDERFFMYPEDIDITRRIHRNWLTMYVPIADIVHAHEAASRRSLKMLKVHACNMASYFCKWGWLHDGERRAYNRRLLEDMPTLAAGTEVEGRG